MKRTMPWSDEDSDSSDSHSESEGDDGVSKRKAGQGQPSKKTASQGMLCSKPIETCTHTYICVYIYVGFVIVY